MVAIAALTMGSAAVFAAQDSAKQSGTQSQSKGDVQDAGGERTISEPTANLLPGNRLVLGRIKEIRGEQIEIDIGNPQPLHVPLKSAKQKGQTFNPGDPIMVTLNDHNAIVDYHAPDEASHHQVLRGKLSTPLTVGLDKAVVETDQGKKTFTVADRAKAKLQAIPVGVEALFMADETGELVDAQLASREAVQASGQNSKAKLKGAHQQVRAIFHGTGNGNQIKISEEGRERQVPTRPPLAKLKDLKEGQEIVLLMDDDGYVMEIATPDMKPSR
jgi:TusA-related sulfurtransferase